MRRAWSGLLGVVAFTLALGTSVAQGQGGEKPRSVSGGGVSVAGWQGKIDASRENGGLSLNDAKLAQDGKALHVTTGPAVVYWNPANVASGDYTIKATFTEPK